MLYNVPMIDTTSLLYNITCIYVYIFIYVCVCMCVCFILLCNLPGDERDLQIELYCFGKATSQRGRKILYLIIRKSLTRCLTILPLSDHRKSLDGLTEDFSTINKSWVEAGLWFTSLSVLLDTYTSFATKDKYIQGVPKRCIHTSNNCICEHFKEEDFYFQQDWAPPHYHCDVTSFLNERFPNGWIGRRGFVEYPPRSPDLTPLDFFLWGYPYLCIETHNNC